MINEVEAARLRGIRIAAFLVDNPPTDHILSRFYWLWIRFKGYF